MAFLPFLKGRHCASLHLLMLSHLPQSHSSAVVHHLDHPPVAPCRSPRGPHHQAWSGLHLWHPVHPHLPTIDCHSSRSIAHVARSALCDSLSFLLLVQMV